MSDEPKIDLEAWEPQSPPSDFAERVLARVRAEAPVKGDAVPAPSVSRRRRVGVATGIAGILALAAALALRVTTAPRAHGEAIAKDRLEVSIGSRARAVLEPGAQVKWDGDDVVQAHGDVFYRVEPGARFVVHTPAGDVEVKGTCFAVKIRGEATNTSSEGVVMNKRDVKSGVVGAALAGLAFVAVYEGKVAVSHASGRVDVSAGQSAQLGADGVRSAGNLREDEKAFDTRAVADPVAQANDNLVAQVSEYRARLEAIVAQKATLKQTLKNTEQKLAAQGDGSAARPKADFDLAPDDWRELAKEGTVKFQMPCKRSAGWSASPEDLQKLALAPQDGAILKSAYVKSNERMWATIRPLCGQVMGNVEIADKIGVDTCVHLILDQTRDKDKEATHEAMRQVGEIRAGQRPPPGPNDPTDLVLKMFLALTGEMKSFEADLAQSLGPEEAHRVAFADGMCMGRSTFRGGGSREPQKK